MHILHLATLCPMGTAQAVWCAWHKSFTLPSELIMYALLYRGGLTFSLAEPPLKSIDLLHKPCSFLWYRSIASWKKSLGWNSKCQVELFIIGDCPNVVSWKSSLTSLNSKPQILGAATHTSQVLLEGPFFLLSPQKRKEAMPPIYAVFCFFCSLGNCFPNN